MSSLYGLLDLGAGAILSHNAGVSVAGRNIANVDTEGYTRESVELQSLRGAPLVGGVRSNGPRRADTTLLAARERMGAGEFGFARSLAAGMSRLENAVTTEANDLIGGIADLFGRIGELTASPMDETIRAAVVSSADQLSRSFGSVSAEIETTRSDANARIEDDAAEATRLAGAIADANKALALSDDPVLHDQRELAAKQLADLVGGAARVDADGKMRFVVGGGAVVVDGDRAASFEIVPDAADPVADRIELVDGTHRTDVTSLIDGGAVAGHIRVRDSVATTALAEVDQLAFDLANQINAVHSAHQGLDGIGGRNFFASPGGVAGAAAAMAVDPGVKANPSQVATRAAGGAAGDNAGALGLLDLRDAKLAAGSSRSFGDESIRIAVSIGRQAANAAGDVRLSESRAEALATLRDSQTGVSIEEEMTRLSQFRHAAEAATQFVATVDGLLANLLQVL